MKQKLFAVLAMVTLVASAGAATTNNNKKLKKNGKKAKILTTSRLKTLPSHNNLRVEPSTEAKDATASSKSQDTVKTSAASAIPSVETTAGAAGAEGPKSPWSMVLFSYLDSPTFTYEKANYEWKGNHYLGVGYKFDSGWRISATGNVRNNWTKGTVQLGDPYAVLGSPSASLGGLNISFKPRHYIPVSRAAGSTFGTFQPRVYADASGNGFDFVAIAIPTFNIPGPKAAADSNTAGFVLVLGGSYNVSDNFSIDVIPQPGFQAKRDGSVEWDSTTDVGVTFKLSERLKINPYVEFPLGDITNAEKANFQTYFELSIL